jgi:hypothetical protein
MCWANGGERGEVRRSQGYTLCFEPNSPFTACNSPTSSTSSLKQVAHHDHHGIQQTSSTSNGIQTGRSSELRESSKCRSRRGSGCSRRSDSRSHIRQTRRSSRSNEVSRQGNAVLQSTRYRIQLLRAAPAVDKTIITIRATPWKDV